MKTIMILAVLALIGCGRVPELPATSSVPTAAADGADGTATAPQPEVVAVAPVAPGASVITVITYTTWNNTYSFCNAVRNWVPATQVILFPFVANSTSNYRFEQAGVFKVTQDGTVSNPGNKTLVLTFCTIVIQNGQFISVTP